MTLENEAKAQKLLLTAFDFSCLVHDQIWDMAINKTVTQTQIEIVRSYANKVLAATVEIENLLKDLPAPSVGEVDKPK